MNFFYRLGMINHGISILIFITILLIVIAIPCTNLQDHINNININHDVFEQCLESKIGNLNIRKNLI